MPLRLSKFVDTVRDTSALDGIFSALTFRKTLFFRSGELRLMGQMLISGDQKSVPRELAECLAHFAFQDGEID